MISRLIFDYWNYDHQTDHYYWNYDHQTDLLILEHWNGITITRLIKQHTGTLELTMITRLIN